MTYELAKQLKDAGFEQREYLIERELAKDILHDVGYHLTWDDTKARYSMYFAPEYIASEEGAPVYVPTLSELISSCGDNGGFALIEEKVGYSAYVGWAEDDYSQKGLGKTPEEAVAKLWLALN